MKRKKADVEREEAELDTLELIPLDKMYRFRGKEIKSVDGLLISMNIKNIPTMSYTDSGDFFTVLNMINQGTGFFQRVGSRITMLTLELKITFDIIENALDQLGGPLTYGIVYDEANNANFVEITDIIQSTTQASGPVTSAYSFRNLNYRERFTVLFENFHKLSPVSSGFSVLYDPNQYLYKRIDLKGRKTFYNSSNVTSVLNINTGGLYLYSAADVPPAPTYEASFGWRLRYIDE